MKRLFRRGWLVGVAVLAVVAVAAGCGSGGSSGSSGNAGGSSPSSSSAPPVKIGLVTDIGGLNDRCFNQLAYVGLQQRREAARA